MLAEFIQKIVDLASKAATPTTIPVKGTRTTMVFLGGTEGNPIYHDQVTHDTVNDLESFCGMAGKLGDGPREIFVNATGIAARDGSMDIGASLSTVRMPTPWSAQMRWLIASAAGVGMTLAQARDLFRVTLREGTGPILAALSRLEFKRTSANTVGASRTKESMGQAVEKEVQGIGELPESVTVRVPAFMADRAQGLEDLAIDVELLISVDFTNEKIVICPPAGAVDAATDRALSRFAAELAKGLEGKDATVSLGTAGKDESA